MNPELAPIAGRPFRQLLKAVFVVDQMEVWTRLTAEYYPLEVVDDLTLCAVDS